MSIGEIFTGFVVNGSCRGGSMRPDGEGLQAPAILLIGGGSGSRSLTFALGQAGMRVTRLVPAWDSGGSSRLIRERLGILPVGDIRQALMTLAHGERRAGAGFVDTDATAHVIRICNTRLPDEAPAPELQAAFALFKEGTHPAMRALDPGLRGAISLYLDLFQRAAGPDFDLRQGSIGNFILTGACLAHDRDINTAIFVFRQLCGIAGGVWPTSTDEDVDLVARDAAGSEIVGQHAVTAMAHGARAPLADVALRRQAGGPVRLNPAAAEAVASAQAIVYGPGSFFTSVLPHLLVPGLAEAIALRADIPRIFVGNMLECAETRGHDLAGLVGRFCETARQMIGDAGGPAGQPVVSHVLAHRASLVFSRRTRGFGALPPGNWQAGQAGEAGIRWIEDDYEDPWQRGAHDGPRLAMLIRDLAG